MRAVAVRGHSGSAADVLRRGFRVSDLRLTKPLLGGAPFVPSQYGQKYLHGLVRAPETLVYVSRGLGTSGLPSDPQLVHVSAVAEAEVPTTAVEVDTR